MFGSTHFIKAAFAQDDDRAPPKIKKIYQLQKSQNQDPYSPLIDLVIQENSSWENDGNYTVRISYTFYESRSDESDQPDSTFIPAGAITFTASSTQADYKTNNLFSYLSSDSYAADLTVVIDHVLASDPLKSEKLDDMKVLTLDETMREIAKLEKKFNKGFDLEKYDKEKSIMSLERRKISLSDAMRLEEKIFSKNNIFKHANEQNTRVKKLEEKVEFLEAKIMAVEAQKISKSKEEPGSNLVTSNLYTPHSGPENNLEESRNLLTE